MSDAKQYSDMELEYAASGRCQCGSGLALPLDTTDALKLRGWACARVLRGESPADGHTFLDFALYKVREETSVNNGGGLTTRPVGTIALTVGNATCPQCQRTWESEPYSACGKSHHWFSGPCPACGYSVGGAGTWSSRDGSPIETRYRTVVMAVRRVSLPGVPDAR